MFYFLSWIDVKLWCFVEIKYVCLVINRIMNSVFMFYKSNVNNVFCLLGGW